MSVVTESELKSFEEATSRVWWLFLIAGIAWFVIGFMVLSIDPTTPAMIGYLTGFVLIVAGLNEFATAGLVSELRWLHVVLGILFVIGGIMALVDPFQTFGVLALLIGWYLLFKGIADIAVSILRRDVVPLWGLLLAAGIAQILIGVWAIGYPGRSAWLLVVWVGIAALTRGIAEMAVAFQLRSARPAAA